MEVARLLLGGSGLVVLVALALSESFTLLPGALVAYTAAWAVLALERRAPTGSGESR